MPKSTIKKEKLVKVILPKKRKKENLDEDYEKNDCDDEDIIEIIDDEMEELNSDSEDMIDTFGNEFDNSSDLQNIEFEKVSSELNELLNVVEKQYIEWLELLEEDEEFEEDDFIELSDEAALEIYDDLPTVSDSTTSVESLLESKSEDEERDLSNIFDLDVKAFIKIADKYPPIEHSLEKKYLIDAQSGDPTRADHAREMLILHNLRLVISIANFFKFKINLPFMELLQEGVVWLLKAIKEFDRQKFWERKFSTYAWRKIQNSLYWIRWKNSWLKITEWNFYMKQKLDQYIHSYKEENWTTPTKRECCEKLGLKPKKYEYLINFVSATTSLSTQIGGESSEEWKTLEDFISDIDNSEYHEDINDTIDNSLEQNVLTYIKITELTPKEKRILEFLYDTPFYKKNNNPDDFREVIDYEYLGDLFGYSSTRMKQLQTQILKKLKYFVKKHKEWTYKIPTHILMR